MFSFFLIIFLSTVFSLAPPKYKFLPEPTRGTGQGPIKEGYETCDSFVDYMNMPVDEILNGRDRLVFKSRFFAYVKHSICFNGIIKASDGIIKVEPFRVTFNSSYHTIGVQLKSARYANVESEEILWKKVEGTNRIGLIDMKKEYKAMFDKHTECIGLNLYAEIKKYPPFNVIWAFVKGQCIKQKKKDDAVTLIRLSGDVFHSFNFNVETFDQETGQQRLNDMNDVPLGPTSLPMVDGLRIGNVLYEGGEYVQTLPRNMMIQGQQLRNLWGANEPTTFNQNQAFAYRVNGSFEQVYDQSLDHPIMIDKSDPALFPLINPLLEYEAFSSASNMLVGKNYIKGQLRITLETSFIIKEIIQITGIISNFTCAPDDPSNSKYFVCTVTQFKYPGNTKLLFFYGSDTPLLSRPVFARQGERILFEPFGILPPDVTGTAWVCTLYGVCKSIQFKQKQTDIIFGKLPLPPKVLLPSPNILDIVRYIAVVIVGEIVDTIGHIGKRLTGFWAKVWEALKEPFGDILNALIYLGVLILTILIVWITSKILVCLGNTIKSVDK